MTPVKMTRRNTFRLCLVIFIVSVNLFNSSSGHSHGGHSHHHSEEAPSFKYSKEANQPYESSKHDHAHHVPHKHGGKLKEKPRDVLTLWLESLLSTLLISAAPFIILFFIPIDNRLEHEPKLKVLLSFASGGLLGDAFLHLIPHALLSRSPEGDSHSHSHSHSHSSSHGASEHSDVHGHDMSVGLWVLAGIVVFLMVEKFVRIVKGGHGHAHGSKMTVEAEHSSDNKGTVTNNDCVEKEDIPPEGKTAEDSPNKTPEDTSDKTPKDSPNKTSEDFHDETIEDCPNKASPPPTEDSPKTKDASIENCEGKVPDVKVSKRKADECMVDGKDVEDIKVAGYLNLAADFTHNFTDGLAIGASYLAGKSVGMITTTTILLHEVPHEIGDFAILIQSGCSKRKAIMLQLVTAVGALTGTVCSLLAEGLDPSATNWILPFTAGGFIYIATVSVIPELLEDTKFWQSVKEVIALLVGVFMMVLIAEYE